MFSLPLLCCSFCHRLVLFSSAYHIQAIASGVPVSWRHQPYISHSRVIMRPPGHVQTHAYCADSYTTQQRCAGAEDCQFGFAAIRNIPVDVVAVLQFQIFFLIGKIICVERERDVRGSSVDPSPQFNADSLTSFSSTLVC